MTLPVATLTDQLPEGAEPDEVFAAFADWTAEQGFSLYPHQEEALIEIVSGANVILSTPTGSGCPTSSQLNTRRVLVSL